MNGEPVWSPTKFLRFEEAFDTSMGTAKIVTDAGPAYIKALGNRQGPHPLACEWVGTQLARWFGLPTFDFALLTIDATVDEIPFLRGGKAASGTAFVTREAKGHPWGGDADGLKALSNPDARLLDGLYSRYEALTPTRFFFNRHGLLHGMRGALSIDQMNCARTFTLLDLLVSAELGYGRSGWNVTDALVERVSIYRQCVLLPNECRFLNQT
jgi:hypothetical protein